MRKVTKVTEKQVAYLTGINDAIVRLEELRTEVSGAYEMGILQSISTLEKYLETTGKIITMQKDDE